MLLSFKHVYYYYDYSLNVYQSDRCGQNTSTQPHTIYTHTAWQIPTQYDRLWENTLIYVSYMYEYDGMSDEFRIVYEEMKWTR